MYPLRLKLKLTLLVYRFAWVVLLPLVLFYFWQRGKKEPGYRQHWAERFGRITLRVHGPCLWFHGASLGELKGAAPLIRALVASGTNVVVTTHTPAGRRTIEDLCASEIAKEKLQVAYCPMELAGAVRTFARRVQPQRLIVTEIDTWPVMLNVCRQLGVKAALVNGQYPEKSFVRDNRWGGIRSDVFRLYDLIVCKTKLHADRFRSAGCEKIAIAGELRFDLPQPLWQIAAAEQFMQTNANQTGRRPVICLASCGPGEEELAREVYQTLRSRLASAGCARPLFVHVPRSPQRFDSTYALLQDAGLVVARRSSHFDAALQSQQPLPATVDVLLGDSLGEMSFYLKLADLVVVGNSFNGLGAHNIIEPLALKKPVVVGPSIWGIEYPAREALSAGALIQVADAHALCDTLTTLVTRADLYAQTRQSLDGFYEEHAGATAKHMAILVPWCHEGHSQ